LTPEQVAAQAADAAAFDYWVKSMIIMHKDAQQSSRPGRTCCAMAACRRLLARPACRCCPRRCRR
jgi:hypothetical protein